MTARHMRRVPNRLICDGLHPLVPVVVLDAAHRPIDAGVVDQDRQAGEDFAAWATTARQSSGTGNVADQRWHDLRRAGCQAVQFRFDLAQQSSPRATRARWRRPRTNLSAMARPSPWLAPVMMAERPSGPCCLFFSLGTAPAGGDVVDARVAAQHVRQEMVRVDDAGRHAGVDVVAR